MLTVYSILGTAEVVLETLKQLRTNGLRIQGVEYQNTTAKGTYLQVYGRNETILRGDNTDNTHELVQTAAG